MANTKSFTVRNITKGVRGLNAVTGYREFEPGESAENVELTEAEFRSADRTGYFTFGDAADVDDDDQDDGDRALPDRHVELNQLAEAEGITFEAGVTTVAAKQAAIVAARAAKARGDTPPGDDLDKMGDDDLRATAAAISGKSVADLASMERGDLLKLARGE